MSDIVERLRRYATETRAAYHGHADWVPVPDLLTAAAEIERLRAELAECRAEMAERDGAGLGERGA